MTTNDRPRCTAKNARGDRCGKAPIKGGTVCATHGGRAPQVKAAAEQRQLEQKADAEVRKLWVGLDAATPVKDPVGSLERLAGALEQAVDVVGAKVNELGHLAGGTGLTQMRGEVVLLERLLGQLRQALDAMARLGIAERHVELEQERAQLVTAAFLAALGAVSLLPADRDLMLRTFLAGLGRGPEELPPVGGAA
jgi:hypothetical protein